MSQRGPSTQVLGMLRLLRPAPGLQEVDVDLGGPPTQAAPSSAEGEQDWDRSTRELLTGVEITDFSDTISGDVFQELFQR